MCGIAGIYVKQPGVYERNKLELLSDWLMLEIEHRGRDATGIFSIGDGETEGHLEKKDVEATKFVFERKGLVENPRIILMHTRFATQGEPTNPDNNHPVTYGDQSGRRLYVTHNGHISNDDKLFKTEELQRFAEVDSEIIPAMIWKYGFDKVHLALQELEGGFAIACVDPSVLPDTVMLAKGSSSPLKYVETDKLLVWASEDSAIRAAWKSTFGGMCPNIRKWSELQAGDILMVTPDGTEKLEFKTNYSRGYTYSGGTSSWPGHSRTKTTSSHQSYTRAELDDLLCVCGETKYWHGGPEYDGAALKANGCKSFRTPDAVVDRRKSKTSGGTASATDGEIFTQDTFIVTKNGDQMIQIQCIGCQRYVPLGECDDVYGYYFCKTCTPESSEDQHTPRTVADNEGAISFNEAAVEETSFLLGIPEAKVTWILWDASVEELNKNETLQDLYIEIHDTYMDALVRVVNDEAADAAAFAAEAEAQGTLGSEDDEGRDCGVRAFEHELGGEA